MRKKNLFTTTMAAAMIVMMVLSFTGCQSKQAAGTENTAVVTETPKDTEESGQATVESQAVIEVDSSDNSVQDEVDEDGIYIGPLDGYITDDTGEMTEDEKIAEAETVRAIEEQFCSTIFNFNSDTEDFTDSLISLAHDWCQYTNEIRNIYPTFSAMEMNTQFVSMMQNTCFFFRYEDHIYARSIVSPFLKGYSKYTEDNDYVSPIVFHMVKEGDRWLLLRAEFSLFAQYGDDFVAHKTPGTHGAKTTFVAHNNQFFWSFTDVEGFLYAREYYSDIEGHLDIPDNIDYYPAPGGTT